MPKGKKRTEAEYEKEIEEASKRMKKHHEFLASAQSSPEWQAFLEDIGIETYKADFWEDVRINVNIQEHGFTEKELAEQRVEIITGKVYRGKGGKFTSEKTDKPIVVYRKDGLFTSKKEIRKSIKRGY